MFRKCYRVWIDKLSYNLFVGWFDTIEEAKTGAFNYLDENGMYRSSIFREWNEDGVTVIDVGATHYIKITEAKRWKRKS